MASEEGVSIAISPVQMAAILHKKTLSEGETWNNRLWGDLGIVGGVVESFGAGCYVSFQNPQCYPKQGV